MYRILRQFYGRASYLPFLAIFLLVVLLIRCKQFEKQRCNSSLSSSTSIQVRSSNRPIKCYLFLLIMTSPKGELRRKAMRETWLTTNKVKNMVVKRRFIVGTAGLSTITKKTLFEEQLQYNDLLLLEDFKDSYNKLTEKLLKTMIWINGNVEANFVMKVDDDTFARLGQLLPSLDKRLNLGRLYWGFFRGNANVKRSGPWKEAKWFLSDHYLPYALGGGYIISSELVEYVAKNANWLSIYNSEDVSLGVWLSPVDVNRIHDIRFDTEYKSKGCSNLHIVSHKQQPEDMYAKHNQLTHHNRLCKKESETLLTYDYNWKESSARCCKRVSLRKLSSNL